LTSSSCSFVRFLLELPFINIDARPFSTKKMSDT
jgi:hypothetical protein